MYKDRRPVFFGLVLIFVGIAIFLSNFDFLPKNIHHYIFRWESFLILIGLLMIFVRGKIIGGISVLAIGAYFLADDLLILPVNWHIWFWPTVLIAMGIGHIVKPNACCTKDKDEF
ncbi:hypothetical protein EO244_09205 [Ancylomarina salipaludis]|uniref:LiaF transmembrane domain-containing protein n=1 Tax=Ancylomarina salipaludis TaxID=2501299 RepID=A0A4Q1JME4_9BACT|nr:DUF5668 domain-containing protein [Ancylomarina salipaludis]RXQ94449.1 hypothetical protein EO244_09205 [Ancylomarina salipaludis]